MRVALYTRVSTTQQSDEMQKRALGDYVRARGWKLAGEFSDVGWSGARERRPGLDRLMEAARKRQLDAVLVWHFDRFARSTRHLLQALEEFRSLGIAFISYSENVDTGSPLGVAMFTIISAIAQLERNVIRERIRAGLNHARAKGVPMGRPRRRVDVELAGMLRADGRGWREVARLMRVSRNTLLRAVRRAEAVAQKPAAGEPRESAESPGSQEAEIPGQNH